MADQKDLKKSVEETVNQILASEQQAANGGATQQIADPTAPAVEQTNKAMPASSAANGGEDKIRSGSPLSEEQKAEEAKKAKDAEDSKRKEDEAKKAAADSDDDDEEDEKDSDKSKKNKMKKSLEELKDVLDDEELELVKTWREECEKEAEVAKSQAAAPAREVVAQVQVNPLAGIEEVLRKAVSEGTADLRKALDEKDTLIKGLSEKIEKMASQPAYDRRSISNLETLEKSGASASGELTKSQVLDKMLELQAAGKGVTSHHIAEFEATKNISDPTVRGIVFRELKVN